MNFWQKLKPSTLKNKWNHYKVIIIGKAKKAMAKTFNDVLTLISQEFRGPETEETWKKRQDLCSKLSDLLERHPAETELPRDFFDHVKPIIIPLVNAATAERTTLSSQACRTMGNVAKALGPQLHSYFDIILPAMISHTGSTKHVNQKNGDQVVTIICEFAGYNPRLVYHILAAFDNKRIPARISAPGWLNILLRHYGQHQERERDYPSIEKALVSGLNDGHERVRVNTRESYWLYKTLPNNGADKIMEGLNYHATRSLLEDPHNPNMQYLAKAAKEAKESRPGSALAQVRAQAKERMQKSTTREITPVSIQSTDYVFGAMSDLTLNEPKKDVQALMLKKSNLSTSTIPTQAPDLDIKDAKSSTSRSFLNAPVRRPRIVATPMAPTSQQNIRPDSRGETSKKIAESKDKPTTEMIEHTIEKSAIEKPSIEKPSFEKLSFEKQSFEKPSVAKSLFDKQSFEKQSFEKPSVAKSLYEKPTIQNHSLDDKENNTLELQNIKSGVRNSSSLESAKRSLVKAIEALRNGTIDALGYRKLKKLLTTYPGSLITGQKQYDELYELLISSFASLDEVMETRSQRASNPNHPMYDRYTMIQSLRVLATQYPCGEPRPGMTLSALLVARSSHANSHKSVNRSITDAATYFVAISDDPLASIDVVLGTLNEVERLILATDSPKVIGSIIDPIYDVTGTPDTDFGVERPALPERLPFVMGLGLSMLTELLSQALKLGQSLPHDQEMRLVSLAQRCLNTYNSVLRRRVMLFCVSLYAAGSPDQKFYSYFTNETDRNLVSYYIASAQAEFSRAH